jgi:hypothetical protein
MDVKEQGTRVRILFIELRTGEFLNQVSYCNFLKDSGLWSYLIGLRPIRTFLNV